MAQKALKVSKQNAFVQKVITLDSVQNSEISKNKLVITLSDLVSSVNVSEFPVFYPEIVHLTFIYVCLFFLQINECNNFVCKAVDVHQNVALVLCSSGTTGLPKGVELTQHNILIAIGQLK